MIKRKLHRMRDFERCLLRRRAWRGWARRETEREPTAAAGMAEQSMKHAAAAAAAAERISCHFPASTSQPSSPGLCRRLLTVPSETASLFGKQAVSTGKRTPSPASRSTVLLETVSAFLRQWMLRAFAKRAAGSGTEFEMRTSLSLSLVRAASLACLPASCCRRCHRCCRRCRRRD